MPVRLELAPTPRRPDTGEQEALGGPQGGTEVDPLGVALDRHLLKGLQLTGVPPRLRGPGLGRTTTRHLLEPAATGAKGPPRLRGATGARGVTVQGVSRPEEEELQQVGLQAALAGEGVGPGPEGTTTARSRPPWGPGDRVATEVKVQEEDIIDGSDWTAGYPVSNTVHYTNVLAIHTTQLCTWIFCTPNNV